jgi:FrmR/RcnR family transcriptional regulator, repressor of rcnA expression
MSTLSHTMREKLKLLNRVKRVRGQIEAVERALEEEKGCANVLHLIVAARGALSSLMTEVIEDHIRLHVVDPSLSQVNAAPDGNNAGRDYGGQHP